MSQKYYIVRVGYNRTYRKDTYEHIQLLNGKRFPVHVSKLLTPNAVYEHVVNSNIVQRTGLVTFRFPFLEDGVPNIAHIENGAKVALVNSLIPVFVSSKAREGLAYMQGDIIPNSPIRSNDQEQNIIVHQRIQKPGEIVIRIDSNKFNTIVDAIAEMYHGVVFDVEHTKEKTFISYKFQKHHDMKNDMPYAIRTDQQVKNFLKSLPENVFLHYVYKGPVREGSDASVAKRTILHPRLEKFQDMLILDKDMTQMDWEIVRYCETVTTAYNMNNSVIRHTLKSIFPYDLFKPILPKYLTTPRLSPFKTNFYKIKLRINDKSDPSGHVCDAVAKLATKYGGTLLHVGHLDPVRRARDVTIQLWNAKNLIRAATSLFKLLPHQSGIASIVSLRMVNNVEDAKTGILVFPLKHWDVYQLYDKCRQEHIDYPRESCELYKLASAVNRKNIPQPLWKRLLGIDHVDYSELPPYALP